MCSLTKMMSVTLIDISSCYFINILIDGCVTNPSPSLVFVFRCLNQRLISLELSAAFRFPPSKTHPLEFLRFFNFRQRFAWNLFRMVATKFRILARFFGTRQGFLNEILINDISFGSMAFYTPPPPTPTLISYLMPFKFHTENECLLFNWNEFKWNVDSVYGIEGGSEVTERLLAGTRLAPRCLHLHRSCSY